MAQLNPKEMQQALAKPFAPEDLEWRLQNTTEEKMRGLAVPYVTNRAIQNRLDEVCGPENWYNDFKPWHSNGKKEAQLCGIAIYFEGRGFITKWDGAEDSDIESVKGGLSDSNAMRYNSSANSGMEAVLMFGPECSTDEAVRDTMNDVPPVCERHIVKHHYFGESDYPYVSRLLPP